MRLHTSEVAATPASGYSGCIEIKDEITYGLATVIIESDLDDVNVAQLVIDRDQAQQIVDQLTRLFSLGKPQPIPQPRSANAEHRAAIRDAFNARIPVTTYGNESYGLIQEIKWSEVDGDIRMECAVAWLTKPGGQASTWHNANDLIVLDKKA